MISLTKITKEELKDKRLTGLDDTPGLSSIAMQERFDAHPDRNTEAINANADIQNGINSEFEKRILDCEDSVSKKQDSAPGMGLYPEGKAFTDNNFTTAEKQKLASIEEGANRYDDTFLRKTVEGKVDAVTGMGLSEENFTKEEKLLVNKINDKADKKALEEVNQKIESLGGCPMIEMTADTASIEADKFYRWGEKASLTVTLTESKPGTAGEYRFSFISGSTPTALKLPEGIKWATPFKTEAGKTYEVSILNGIGVMFGA